MSKKPKTTVSAPKNVEYRVFNLPGYGRLRAPADMTEESLIEAMRAGDPVVAPERDEQIG